MIHFVVQATDQNLEPAEVICDFEAGLMNSIQTQFPNAIVLGCLFHMKQALRRAMKRYAIPDEECSIAMTPGVLDMLTVMDPARINKGSKWAKREMKMRCPEAGLIYSAEKWSEFWGYFARTWLEQYPIEVWNVYGLENELIERTSSPLEMFNIELNARFPTAHPSMATFITVIKTLSAEYVRRIADIPRGRARHVSRDRIQLPQPVAINSYIDSEVEEHAADTSADASVTSIAL
ncbi:unnamed protein product [Phytophthora lilii]|uniref:Unnamed protein product n=1 Tax=Phytophthora lilii TaxID=2077276 RepID=A0A9W6U5Z4_9STRA|nr:unnamed protein product [Phytophthora lilii]